MTFIDSHCHLDFQILSSQLDDVLADALEKGVTEYVVPSITRENFAIVAALGEKYPQIHFALGLHPCFIAEHRCIDIELLSAALEKFKPCAVGEIGLDFFIDKPQQVLQTTFFEQQLNIAKNVELPVILHVRKAHDQVLALLRKTKFNNGGIVHAFNGSEQQAQRYIEEFGFKLGFGGAITYPRALKLRRLAASLPIESIVLETDAPDMPLADDHISYNRPANIAAIAEQLAQLREVPVTAIQDQLRANVMNVLKLV